MYKYPDGSQGLSPGDSNLSKFSQRISEVETFQPREITVPTTLPRFRAVHLHALHLIMRTEQTITDPDYTGSRLSQYQDFDNQGYTFVLGNIASRAICIPRYTT